MGPGHESFFFGTSSFLHPTSTPSSRLPRQDLDKMADSGSPWVNVNMELDRMLITTTPSCGIAKKANCTYADLPGKQRRAYDILLSRSPTAFDFLFGELFSAVLGPIIYDAKIFTIFAVEPDRAIEEFRRFLALKLFTRTRTVKFSARPLLWKLSGIKLF
jgi:hypothetical protein